MKETVIEKIVNERTGESYYKVDHSSGLCLLLMPMEGYVQTYALFSTKYGSINRTFKTSGDEEFCTVPDGIAHYLEHKLFENEDCAAFELYAKTGASANAYTGFERTSYLFSCSENYLESLKILTDLVQTPYFTQENVDKERGIIAQEIRMSNDVPRRRVFFNLLKALYHEHPINTDIAGTEESIAEITPELLYKCYDAFYDLHNMVLAVAGNLDVDEVIKHCDENLKPSKDVKVETKFPEEPDTVVTERVEENFSVGVPMFNIGFKCKAMPPEELLRKEMIADIMLNLLAGKSSELYRRITDRQLMQVELGREVFSGNGYFSLLLTGESEDPDAVLAEVWECIDIAKEKGFDEHTFELNKKADYGATIQLLGYAETCAEEMTLAYYADKTCFDLEDMLASITLDDVNNAVKELFARDKCCISVLR